LSEPVLEEVEAREVAGVFRSHDALENAADALLRAGFDRADIDLMASADTVRKKLGAAYVAAEELASAPAAPRRAFVAREDLPLIAGGAAGILTYIGATAAALSIVASGGALAAAAVAALGGAAGAGGIGALLISRFLGREQAEELEAKLAAGGLVLWVRVRTPEQEEKALRILREHGGEAVRVHEIKLAKRVDDLPLSKVRPDPWLGPEPLAHP
jgi:hypothetical protein